MGVSRADVERGLDEVTRPFLAHVTALHAAHGGVTEIRVIRRGVIWATRIAPGARFTPNTTTVSGGRPVSGVGGVSQFGTEDGSDYHSLQLRTYRRLRRKWHNNCCLMHWRTNDGQEEDYTRKVKNGACCNKV